MSDHKIPLTELEKKGLEAHGLRIGVPSQLSDAFRHGMKWAQAARDAEVAELRTKLEEAERKLGDLLARIHRDGGHYTGQHGMEKSVEDAHTIVANLFADERKLAEAATENAALRLLIDEAITSMSHAEVFIDSREKMHPTGVQLWGELLDRMHDAIRAAMDKEQDHGN